METAPITEAPPKETRLEPLIPPDYATEASPYDEMWDGNAQIHPHWARVMRALEKIGGAGLESRRQEAKRLLRENGVTYNIYGDPQGMQRPWDLDPVPFLLDKADWARIEAALIQRAELLNLILADLYGPRALIKAGLLPPELVYTHAGFLRPCDQVAFPTANPLALYAADIARTSDGQLRVLADRTQSPAGAGYALENRMTMNRILPGVFRDCHVRRLAFFFLALRESLAAISPNQKSDPRIVVLTGGPDDGTYFEHAYLAAYLGYPLVNGDDLTVRDACVWLKSIDGLKPVDIILRRIEDYLCDPLELNEDSQLGVSGLLEAVRQGNVAIANPLGSGVLENPGLVAFLPGLARHLLNQELLLPSVATWWCGQPKELKYVLDNLDKLVIKGIFRRHSGQSVLGFRLSRAELDNLRARIRAHPHLYVGQERVSFSTTPSLINGQLAPRHSVLRTFLVAKAGTYTAMPGGLTRSAAEKGDFIVSIRTKGISRDTWVLTDEPEKPVSLWLQPSRNELIAVHHTVLPSRAAENLFWVGRYAERAEGSARLLRLVLRYFNEPEEFGDDATAVCFECLLRTLTALTNTYPGFIGEGAKEKLAAPESELLTIALDGKRAGSVTATLRLLVQSAYAIRDRWSTDTWRVIDDIEEHWNALQGIERPRPHHVRDELDLLVTDLVALAGLNAESMTRELGWILLDTGRRIERAMLLITLLRSTLVPRVPDLVEQLLLEAVLVVAESLITYRRRYRAYLQLQTVLDLLLLDETNPRSLVYQLIRLQQHIGELPRERVGHRLSPEERLALEATTRLRMSDPVALGQANEGASQHEALEAVLADLEDQLKQISDVLTQTYFSHIQASRQLVTAHNEQ